MGSTNAARGQQPPGESLLAARVAQLRWERRLIICYAPAADHPALRQQRAWLEADPAALADRDLTVYYQQADDLAATDRRWLTNFGRLDLDTFGLVLVGKDGTVKRRAQQPVPAAELFGQIDAMPMRRREMGGK